MIDFEQLKHSHPAQSCLDSFDLFVGERK
ncbi:hypothetical protein DSM3645_02973 [Blastopirellula marina DSM 3645]|uniref:Uncharacterized protein n=1 Tax=Blastopirellula marina DSM 3645 TaxID=314230 RepID=A3ZVQ8_9BACT|nr:hypothetical protein DSM3645_02973 [Blastopirellula marina DSM 3645]